MKLVVPGRLIGLNEYTKACRGNKYAAAKYKKDIENILIFHIKTQFKNARFKGPVFLSFCWYEKSKKRDLDNVAFAKKFFLDAFVKSQTIPNDGWAYVVGFKDSFFVDPKNPRIEVEILEVVS